MPFQKVNGTNYYYELHGKGEPLVLIAGYTCDSTLWTPLLESLKKSFQVLIFDNRGVGQTKDDHGPLKLKDLAKDTVELAEELGLKKPHIVGQSMGGTIAQVIGSTYGNRVGKLVFLVTSEKWRKAMLLGLKSLLDMRENDLSFDEIFNASIGWVFGETFLRDEKMVDFLYDILKNNPYPQSLKDQKRQYALLEEFDGSKFQIVNPTLVISGKEDIVALPEEGEKLAKRIGASFEVLNGAHGVIAENSEGLLHTLNRFLVK